jgi:hypothetical protein
MGLRCPHLLAHCRISQIGAHFPNDRALKILGLEAAAEEDRGHRGEDEFFHE